MTTAKAQIVVLFDADNTLLDNDRVRELLGLALDAALGTSAAERFWELYEQIRDESGIVDFPRAIARFRAECPENGAARRLEYLIFGFPFADVVYDASFAAIKQADGFARTVILSDGDQCFQRHKIRAAGIERSVDGHVLVFDHKELRLPELMKLYPANHYVMVDDKNRIHAGLKKQLGDRITTVMVCQGKYAHDPSHHDFPGTDITIDGIEGFLGLDAPALLAAATARPGSERADRPHRRRGK